MKLTRRDIVSLYMLARKLFEHGDTSLSFSDGAANIRLAILLDEKQGAIPISEVREAWPDMSFRKWLEFGRELGWIDPSR